MSNLSDFIMSAGKAAIVSLLIAVGFFGVQSKSIAQESNRGDSLSSASLRLSFPSGQGWNTVREGEYIGFILKSEGEKTGNVVYSIGKGGTADMKLDSLTGEFSWVPGFDVADRLSTTVPIAVSFEARDESGATATGEVTFKVINVDRPAERSVSSSPFRIVLPLAYGWSTVKEGEEVTFALKTEGGRGRDVVYSIAKGGAPEMKLDSLTGVFSWIPSYDIADRLITSVAVSVLFEARNDAGETTSSEVIFKVNHTNRPPVIDELKTFYVQFKTQNTYQIDPGSVTDLDGDSYVFVPVLETLPEGMQMTEAGQISWEPSQAQFNILKEGARYIEFYVEDQPFKSRTKGRLRLEPTQKDLAPVITIVPKQNVYRIKENAIVNIKFFLSDPNGDDDIMKFDFVSQNKEIPKSALQKNTETNYEFVWEPGYDFVKEPIDSVRFNITFYVLDKAQNRDEKVFQFVVGNTINEEERNVYLFNLYREALVSARDLMEQIVQKENELKRGYRKAKRGKAQRSLINATMGASTGLSPVITKNTDVRTQITTIGGTTVATISTLEATEVIGKSANTLLDRFNKVLEKKNDLQAKGDAFAREFASKQSRATPDFMKKLDVFKSNMSISGLVALELDANWTAKTPATTKEIRKYFKDYVPMEGFN